MGGGSKPAFAVPNWLSASDYAVLLLADRRNFAWEWLRRSASYRAAWRKRNIDPAIYGLLEFENPDLPTPEARPIWTPVLDPRVLSSIAAVHQPESDADLFDIRTLAKYVSVAVDENNAEHWLLSDGHWSVRLDLHEGTLLGGPLYLDYRIGGLEDTKPKIVTLQQLVALAKNGVMPVSLTPRETRATRWILELRTADGLATGANQYEIARGLFGSSVAEARWRIASSSYRLQAQRLVRTARRYLADPLSGPWFR